MHYTDNRVAGLLICQEKLNDSLQRQTSMTEMERWLTGWMDGCTVESKLATLNDV